MKAWSGGGRIAQLWAAPAAITEAVRVIPSTAKGGGVSPAPFQPQQTASRLPDWIAQLWIGPVEIAEAVPEVPFTEAGGNVTPSELSPQQITAPLPDWIAQLW